jgi:hypothetical protein
VDLETRLNELESWNFDQWDALIEEIEFRSMNLQDLMNKGFTKLLGE